MWGRRAGVLRSTSLCVAPSPVYAPALRVGWVRCVSTYREVPPHLRYTKSHEWVGVIGDLATIGITDHAQAALGEVVFVDLPEVGAAFEAKDTFGAVESVKTASDLYMPVSGSIVEVNESLQDAGVGNVNSDPYDQGWMVKIRLANPTQVHQLMDASSYAKHCMDTADH